MIIKCEHCHAKYNISDDLIGERGRSVRCVKCQKTWFATNVIRQKIAIEPDSKKEVFNLPVIRNKKAGLILKIIIAALLFINIISLFVFFKDPMMQNFPRTKFLYELFGVYDAKGLVLKNMAIRKLRNGNINNLLIRGEIYNTTDKELPMPKVKVEILGGSDGKSVIYNNIIDLSVENDKNLQPGEAYIFDRSLGNLGNEANIVKIDLGDKLDMLLR